MRYVSFIIMIIMVILAVIGMSCLIDGSAFAKGNSCEKELMMPKSWYPQPEPKHYPETGAVCWKTETGPWECKPGRAKTEINIDNSNNETSGLFGFGHQLLHKGKAHKHTTPKKSDRQ